MGCTLHFNVKGMLQGFTQVYDSVPHGHLEFWLYLQSNTNPHWRV